MLFLYVGVKVTVDEIIMSNALLQEGTHLKSFLPHFAHFVKDKEQGTPLHAAAYLGDVNTMELLIASGNNLTLNLVNWNIFH